MSTLPLEISVEETRQLMVRIPDELLLLDCRSLDEYKFVHLANTLLIPMDEIAHRLDELSDHVARRIVVYCHMGVRSSMVSRWLRENGFPSTQSLAGGIDAWSVQVDSSLPRY